VGDADAARGAHRESIALWRMIGVELMEGLCLVGVATAAFDQQDEAAAVAEAEQALAIFRASDWTRGVARALERLGLFRYQRGEVEQARRLFDESLEIWQKEDHPDGTAVALSMLGRIDLDLRSLPEAADRLSAALDIRRASGAHSGTLAVVRQSLPWQLCGDEQRSACASPGRQPRSARCSAFRPTFEIRSGWTTIWTSPGERWAARRAGFGFGDARSPGRRLRVTRRAVLYRFREAVNSSLVPGAPMP
jgi:tetratricopeptide (TPR) repeat protein